MQSVTLYRVDSVHNMQRYYSVDIQPDLFGQQCLMRCWGRIGKRGQMRSIPYPSTADAELASEKLLASKRLKGYKEDL